MTVDESQQKREQWIIDYLYGDVSAEEKKIFEDTLKRDTQLRQLYDAHCELDRMMPKGSRPVIADDRLQGLRWAAFRALRAPQRPTLWQKIASVGQIQVPIKRHVLAMAAMFAIGFLVHGTLRPAISTEELAGESSVNLGADNLFSFIDSENYHVVDVNLSSYDERKGDVEFSFGLRAQSKIKGNLNDSHIRKILLATLTAESQDQVRLQLTSMLGGYLDAQDVQASLIYTLLNDPNPGVRYNAVENLVSVAQRPDVRAALLHALAHDVNPGIRVEAFLAASVHLDKALIRVLKNYSVDDANTFIRERSKRILRDIDEGVGSGVELPRKAHTEAI